jgi:SOS-response transcriptional repressor LexA
MSTTPDSPFQSPPPPPSPLTPARERVWRAMLELQAASGGRPPTQAEVSAAVGSKSKQGCVVHFEALSEFGYIVCVAERGRWRSWMAVETPVPRDENAAVFRRYRCATGRRGRPSASSPSFPVPTVEDMLRGPTLEGGFTQRQIDVWHAAMMLQAHSKGRSATQSEISRSLGMGSTQGARSHFARLAEAGYMKHTNRRWYAVVPPNAPAAPAAPDTL